MDDRRDRSGAPRSEEEGDARVLPVVVARSYRGGTNRTADVPYRRSVACRTCGGKRAGCASCAGVGWVVEDAVLTVHLPEEAHPGRRIPHVEAGDLRMPGPGRGDVVVEVVDDEERARVLREAQHAHEALLDDLWTWQREEKRAARNRRVGFIALAAGVLAVGAALFLVRNVGKHEIGAPCARATDCLSELCEPFQDEAHPGVDLPICTAACTTDADCSPSTTCMAVTWRYPSLPDGIIMSPSRDGRAEEYEQRCAPRQRP